MEKKLNHSAIKLISLLMLVLTLSIAHDTTGQAKRIRPIKMVLVPDTVWRQNAINLLRLETIVVQQDSTISDQEKTIAYLDSAKKASDKMLDEGTLREKVLKQDLSAEQEKSTFWKGTAVKYRRQRNLTFAGAVGVVVLSLVVKK